MSSQPGETRIKKNRCTVYFTLACFALGVSVGLVQFCKGFFPLTPLDAPQAQPFSKTGDYKHKLALVFTDTIDTNMSTNGLSMINQRVTQGQGRFFRTRAQATVPGSMHFHLWSVLTGATPTLADTVLRRRVLPEANLANSFAVQGRRVAYDGLFEDNTMKTIVPHAARLSRREEAKGLSWDMLLAHKSSGRVDRYVESVLNAVAGGESDDEEYAKGHGNAIVMMAVVGMDGGAAILSNEFALWKAENEVKEIHLVDICPTVALLAETNIPYGSTGAAVSTLLGGESKTLEGLSKNAEQLKCLMKMRSEKHSNKRNNDNDEDDGFMVNYNMSMSSYKRYKKHKTEKNFVTSLKHFSYFNKVVSDSYERNFWGEVDLYRGYIGLGILVFTVFGVLVSLLAIFREFKSLTKLAVNVEAISLIIALPPFLGSFHVMLCQSAELGITSSTCKGGISNITDVILICLAGGFSVTTLFSVAQIRYFARYKEPLDSEVQHCMSDLAEQIIAVLCTAIRFGSYATPALLAYTNNKEEDTTFAAVAVGIVGYICAVGMRGRTGWKHAAGHLLASLGGVCLMRAWQPLVVPRIAEYPGVCTALVVVSALALMGFTVNILKQEHMFLRYGFWAFIAAMFVGYGAVVYDVVVTADSDTLLWYTVLGVCASGVLYAALWTFFPGTAAPRTSYITFHIAAVLCMLAPFPVLLFAQDREEAPLVLIAALVCYHFGCFLYIADLPTYNSRVVLYRTLMYCMLAKFMTVVFGGGGDSSVSVSDTNSLFEVVSVLARGYAGPIVVFSFAVLSVYQIARKQGPNGPNMFEQGALVASLVVFGVYAGGPAVAAGAALVLHLREPRVAWDVYGPKVFDAAKDAAVGIVVCVALAVYSVVNRSFIINTERERRRQYIKELEKRKQEKKTQ